MMKLSCLETRVAAAAVLADESGRGVIIIILIIISIITASERGANLDDCLSVCRRSLHVETQRAMIRVQ